MQTSHALGHLFAIGGAENKQSAPAVLAKVVSLAPQGNSEVAVIATASGIPDDVMPAYERVFTHLGASRVHLLSAQTRDAADCAENVRAVESSGIVFFTGGDQLRLTSVLGGSALLAAARARFMSGAVIAGTSAGAAALCSTMIYNSNTADALHKGAVNMSAGLGFVDGMIIDTHFLERGRFSRLMEVGAINPEILGVGVGEDAAVIIHPERVLEVIGPGHVILVDSRDLARSNVASLSMGGAVAIEHVIMHALISGHGFDIDARHYLGPDELATRIAASKSS